MTPATATLAPAQTKCRCGHSLAAHPDGPCVGVHVADLPRDLLRGSKLCNCPAMRPAAA